MIDFAGKWSKRGRRAGGVEARIHDSGKMKPDKRRRWKKIQKPGIRGVSTTCRNQSRDRPYSHGGRCMRLLALTASLTIARRIAGVREDPIDQLSLYAGSVRMLVRCGLCGMHGTQRSSHMSTADSLQGGEGMDGATIVPLRTVYLQYITVRL
jgi:hypothetical protein